MVEVVGVALMLVIPGGLGGARNQVQIVAIGYLVHGVLSHGVESFP